MSDLQSENEALKTKIADLEAIIAALREEIRSHSSKPTNSDSIIVSQALRITELEKFIARSQKR